MFRKKQRQSLDESKPGGPPFLPKLFDAINVLPRILEVFKDNRGKMSSKRFGAGALVASGIALVTSGAEQDRAVYYWCGLALCGMGVVLFGLTRWDGKANGSDESGDPPTS